MCRRHLSWNKGSGERSIDPDNQRERKCAVPLCDRSAATVPEQGASVCCRCCAATLCWIRPSTGWRMRKLCADWDCWTTTWRAAAPWWVASHAHPFDNKYGASHLSCGVEGCRQGASLWAPNDSEVTLWILRLKWCDMTSKKNSLQPALSEWLLDMKIVFLLKDAGSFASAYWTVISKVRWVLSKSWENRHKVNAKDVHHFLNPCSSNRAALTVALNFVTVYPSGFT